MSAERAVTIVSAMESDVGDVERWAALLIALSTSSDAIRPEVVGVVGYALASLGTDLHSAWTKAFASLGGTP